MGESKIDLEIEKKLLFETDLTKESKCLDDFKECKPSIKSKSKKYNLNNQLQLDIKHCFCTIKFYNCLKDSPNKLHNRIGQIYFNIFKMKCFHYDYRQKCSLYFLGKCFLNGDFSCHVKLTEIQLF